MWELTIKLLLLRDSLRRKMLYKIGSNDYQAVAAILALVFAGGTFVTGFAASPITLPVGGYASVVALITGVLSVLTIVLLPLGLVLL